MRRLTQLLLDFGKKTKPAQPPVAASESVGLTSPANAADSHSQASSPAAGLDAELTARAKQWSADLGMNKLEKIVTVRWNPRLKTTAGTASPGSGEIDLNRNLWDFGDEQVERVLKHELAHLVAHFRARGKRIAAHGMEWKQACADLGIPDEKSCHTLPFKGHKQKRKYAYQCPNCESVVLRVRPMSRYSACWTCCKSFSGGQYAKRFQFERIPLEQGALLSRLQEAQQETTSL